MVKLSKLKDAVIGKRIRQARLECGFSQEELGEGINLTRSRIANIETGRTTLSLIDAKEICDFLGVDIRELFRTDENEFEALILFRKGEHVSDEELVDWSENIFNELIAQENLFKQEGVKNDFE